MKLRMVSCKDENDEGDGVDSDRNGTDYTNLHHR